MRFETDLLQSTSQCSIGLNSGISRRPCRGKRISRRDLIKATPHPQPTNLAGRYLILTRVLLRELYGIVGTRRSSGIFDETAVPA